MIVKLLKKYESVISYGLISVGVTLVDVLLTYIFKHFTLLVIANTIGVVTGGIIQYILNAKLVFHVKNNNKNLAIYVITFIGGLLIANLIIFSKCCGSG